MWTMTRLKQYCDYTLCIITWGNKIVQKCCQNARSKVFKNNKSAWFPRAILQHHTHTETMAAAPSPITHTQRSWQLPPHLSHTHRDHGSCPLTYHTHTEIMAAASSPITHTQRPWQLPPHLSHTHTHTQRPRQLPPHLYFLEGFLLGHWHKDTDGLLAGCIDLPRTGEKDLTECWSNVCIGLQLDERLWGVNKSVCAHKINFHEINSHEINSHVINSYKNNFHEVNYHKINSKLHAKGWQVLDLWTWRGFSWGTLPLLEVKLANFFSMVNYYPRNLKLKNSSSLLIIVLTIGVNSCQVAPSALPAQGGRIFSLFYLRSPTAALPIPYSSTSFAWDAPAFRRSSTANLWQHYTLSFHHFAWNSHQKREITTTCLKSYGGQ